MKDEEVICTMNLDEIKPVSETWHTIGAFMLWCIFVVLAVICLALFFSGLWVWSLLI